MKAKTSVNPVNIFINMPLTYQLFAHRRPIEKVCNRRKNLDFDVYLNSVPLILVLTRHMAHYSLLYKGYLGYFPEVERQGRGVGHPSNLESRLKKQGSHIATS
jgi:hypothetical protein